MQESMPSYRRGRRRALRLVLCTLAAAATLLATIYFATAAPREETEPPLTVREFDPALSAHLTAAGLDCRSTDYIDAGPEGKTAALWISGTRTAYLSINGVPQTAEAKGETVGELLRRLDVNLEPEDLLIVSGGEESELRVYTVRRQAARYTQEELVARPVSYVEDDTKYQTQEVVLNEGAEGINLRTYEAYTLNNRYAYRTLLSTELVKQPEERVVSRGTKALPVLSPLSMSEDFPVEITEREGGGGTITLLSGETYPYTDVLSVTAFAYTTENKTRTITATGSTARVGAIAVDPKIIPFGTKLFIQTANGEIVYGIATAEDSGAFRGMVVDLFFNTRAECISFGRRACSVYILEDTGA